MDIPEIPSIATSLQSILARKTQERHNRILEQIQQQNADTSRMQAESYEKQREAEARWRDAQASKERLNDFYRGMHIGPDTKKWMQSAGYSDLINSKPTGEFTAGAENEDGSTDVGPFQIMDDTYAGSPQEQQAEEQQKQLEILYNNPEFQQADSLKKTLMAGRFGIKLDPRLFNEGNGIYVFDEATGKVTKSDVDAPDGVSHFFTRNRPPASGGAGGSNIPVQWLQATDEQGKVIPGKWWKVPGREGGGPPSLFDSTLKPGGPTPPAGPNGANQQPSPMPGMGQRVGATPPQPRPPLPTIDEQLGATYTVRRPNAAREDEQRRTALKPAIIAASPASPLVKELAMDIVVQNPKNYEKYSTATIVENTHGEHGEPLSTDDKQRLAELLAFLRDGK